MKNVGKWLVGLEGVECWNDNTALDTMEEAIEHGREVLQKWNRSSDDEKIKTSLSDEISNHYDDDMTNINVFVVGRMERVNAVVDADNIIDMIAEATYDNADLPETLDNYLEDIEEAHVEELHNLIAGWLDKHDYNPQAFTLEETRTVDVYPDDKEESNHDT